MLLGKGYDRSLWMMLKINKVDRNNIINLINEIPCELYDEIRNKIYSINCGIEKDDENKNNGNCIMGDRKYYYRINPYNYCLSIGRSKKDGDIYNEEIELNLGCISRDNLINEHNLIVSSIQYNNGDIRNLCLGDHVLCWNCCRYTLITDDYGNIEGIDIINVNSIQDRCCDKNIIDKRMLVRKRG